MLLALMPAATFLLKVLATERRWRFQLFADDAFYYLGVARNLAHGNGSTFTGLVETNGYQPLWMLLLVPVARLFERPDDLFLAVAVLQCGLWAVSVREALHIGEAIGSWLCAAGALAVYAVLAVLTGQLAFNGMESALLLPLLLIAVRLVITAEEGPRDDLRLGVVFALVCLARLDAVIVASLLGVVAAMRGHPGREVVAVRLAQLGGPIAVALGGYVLVSLVAFGTPTPVSGQAKSLGAPFFNTEPIEQFLKAGDLGQRPLWFGAAALIVVAAAWVTRDRRPREARRRLMTCVLALVGGQALLLASLAVLTSYRIWPWYHYQLAVFSFGAAALLLGRLADRDQEHGRRLARGLVAGFLVVQLLVALRDEDPDYGASVSAAAFVRSELPDDAVLAMGDRAGTFGFLADQPLLHVEGLMADTNLLRHLEAGRATLAMADAGVDYYVNYGAPAEDHSIDGRSCLRFNEPVQGESTKSPVVVCEEDLVFEDGPEDDSLRIWRFRPELQG